MDKNYLLFYPAREDDFPPGIWLAIPLVVTEQAYAADTRFFLPRIYKLGELDKEGKAEKYKQQAHEFVDSILANTPILLTTVPSSYGENTEQYEPQEGTVRSDNLGGPWGVAPCPSASSWQGATQPQAPFQVGPTTVGQPPPLISQLTNFLPVFQEEGQAQATVRLSPLTPASTKDGHSSLPLTQSNLDVGQDQRHQRQQEGDPKEGRNKLSEKAVGNIDQGLTARGSQNPTNNSLPLTRNQEMMMEMEREKERERMKKQEEMGRLEEIRRQDGIRKQE
jgi:hypothetical protein